AVLMLEIALADSGIDEHELKVIENTMSLHFHLNQDEIKEIIETARTEVDHAISLHDFTRTVNEELNAEEKVTVIELLWRVAVADNVIDKYEEYFIRKIADLLYVSHANYIKAKHQAAKTLDG
ncbi:MAG: TerB family tellurite resistance protein, partial [Gammaproteobacteria bacterium]|nr:TerB family tellurite resistance protein [Gammaproteobacteria bacterium]